MCRLKTNFFLLFLSCLLFSNCKKNSYENKEERPVTQIKADINFDAILKCSEFSYNETYFFTADYGCIYDPKGENKFGNLIVYLVSKNEKILIENEVINETEKINNSDIISLKENFEIFVFLIPKDYLNYNTKGDPIYYQKEKYKEELYKFDSKQNKWKFVDSIDITKESESQKEQNWRENHLLTKVNNEENLQNIESYKIPKGFYILDSAFVHLENKNYKILALEKDIEKNNQANWHFDLPIIILDENYTKIQNNNLVFKFNDNCSADGFDGIVVKKKFFTIQQISCLDFLYVNSYITFKVDETTGKILLHKYSEEYTDRSNPDKKIPTKIWSDKNFGVKKFEDVTEEFLKNLRKE